ncbi:MAG: BlaI/MecI/CopY family transcriptional regulator [Pirellulaceae bacterium]|nr:BlaI/MecI/CopY family transcriptional regulator [Pirellulaceae bacterium]
MTDLDLPPAELDVLQCLWEAEEMTARQVREMLAQRRPLSHSSVCTLLERLSGKGFVTRKKGHCGKAFVYQAKIAPNKTCGQVIGGIVDRVFGGSGVDLVASLLETKPLTASEIGQLQCLLDDLKAKQATQGNQRSSQASADKKNERGPNSKGSRS